MEDNQSRADYAGQVFSELLQCVNDDEIDRAKLLLENLSEEIRETVCKSVSPDRSHFPLLMSAIRLQRAAFVELFLEERCGDTEQNIYLHLVDRFCSNRFRITVTCIVVDMFPEVLETFVRHGADVNALSAQSTPLHLACFTNNIDVVRFLVENGADVNRPDYLGTTCLMVAATRNVDICRFLIEQHALINAVNNGGNSALHRAIMEDDDQLDSVQLLMEHGADPTIRNHDSDDALQSAALFGRPETVEYLVEKINPTSGRKADAFSLLAAAVMDNGIPERALHFWTKSANIRMEELTEDPNEAVSVAPIAAYNFAVEAKDIESVQNLAHDVDAMRMQALVVRERIIGLDHCKTIRGLINCAIAHADMGAFQRCLELSKYAMRNLKLELDHTGPRKYDIPRSLRKLCSTLSRIGRENPTSIRFGDLADMLQCMVKKTGEIVSSVAACPAKKAFLPAMALHLIQLLCCLTLTEAENSVFRQLVRALVQTRFRTSDGCTLLHIAVRPRIYAQNNSETPNHAISAVVDCLLTAGAAVDAVNSAGNTPLHVAVFKRPTDWEKTSESLLNHGAHLDKTNAKREVVYDKLPANVDVFKHVSLACLAARAVRAYQLPYRGIVPETLADFVDYH